MSSDNIERFREHSIYPNHPSKEGKYVRYSDHEHVVKGLESALNEILSALRNERERCAKVAETAFTEFQTGYNAGKWIAKAIREGR